MNKTELKNFAINARQELLRQVSLRAKLFGIDDKTALTIEVQSGQLLINGELYPVYLKSAFSSLQKQLEQKGHEQVLEEVAYTWFNRIIAIRYMEIHDYLPERVNVLSSSTGQVDPDILTEFESMELPVNNEEVRELLNNGDTEGAYRKLLIAQCNALNEVLPFMFENIQDYTELLLPDFLLDRESIINTLVQNGELTKSFGKIEVIGWLYQYYIAEEKDRVFKQKSKYTKEEIPFATQLFTPNWIVQYMVQNSLGRYWTEAHPEDEDLIVNWDYFLKHGKEDFKEKIATYVNKELKVEDIKCFDPAMGSGHILVYMFDVLYEIYRKRGYMESEIPKLILENNLYGLDIDDRAYQLASFAVVMKAVQYNKRFLRSIQREGITLHLASIQETNNVADEVIAYIAGEEQGDNFKKVQAFFNQYQNAKTYGSLINISERDTKFIEQRLQEFVDAPVQDLFQADYHTIALDILPDLIKQARIMRNEYDIVVMNPPYMGSGSMSKELSGFLKKNYPDSKSDLFSAFMEVDQYEKDNGFYAAINQHSWMFLSSFEKLRGKIISNKYIDTMLHLGPRAFEEIGGEVVQSTAFILRNNKMNNGLGVYLRLVDERTATEKREKVIEAVQNPSVSYRFSFNQEKFSKIPGSPIGYWVSDKALKSFNNKLLVDYAYPKQGFATGKNDRFLRVWHEVNYNNCGWNFSNNEEAKHSELKWFPCNKGGSFRKWFGNNTYMANWQNDGYEMRSFAGSVIRNPQFYFQEGMTWSTILLMLHSKVQLLTGLSVQGLMAILSIRVYRKEKRL
ncbi:BREX-1 system adenine-specific DNA-methyltransferase PglX, partial [Sporosarcina sp. E16_8]|uniref:BREX-1 system adenine-specific DNA-methyltransferase PglX n=1 Tax=Sporosarcina sp. E16_8 TaxID=2789295 RepID=UPI001A92E865